MKCLKCGRETDQTFCEACRAEMEKYPVKPGTIVLLPKERTPIRKPSPRYVRPSLESVVISQKKTIRRMGRAIAILAGLTAILTAALILLVENEQPMPLGKNYSTVTRPATETTEWTEETLPPEATGTVPSTAPTQRTVATVQPSEAGNYTER